MPFRLILAALVTLIQWPAVAWLTARFSSPIPVFVAVALSLPYMLRLRSPWSSDASAATYVALAWWSACLVFAVLLPLSSLVHLTEPAFFLSLLLGVGAVFNRPRLVRKTVHIRDLPPALDGYRIGQISDVHCGPHVPASRVEAWVQRLNGLDLDMMTVTGDLITHGHAYVPAVARALGGLRARDGVYACMGNHDYFTDGEALARELRDNGLHVLRNRGVTLPSGLHVAGVDDTWTRRHDVPRALRDRPKGAPTVLLAHDPNLFPQAAEHRVDLTLSGHTHGGQLGIPFLRRWSLARFVTRFTAGLFERDGSWLYVNRGAGTTGPPVRLGAPPELAVLTLKRANRGGRLQ